MTSRAKPVRRDRAVRPPTEKKLLNMRTHRIKLRRYAGPSPRAMPYETIGSKGPLAEPGRAGKELRRQNRALADGHGPFEDERGFRGDVLKGPRWLMPNRRRPTTRSPSRR